MTLPIDLVIVRHGQSEGNLAKRLSESGDHKAYALTYKARHTRSFRLTELGRAQAVQAGMWLNTEFGMFDRWVVSEYARALETAALLDLPDAGWYTNFYLTERDWGDVHNASEAEREERFGDALRMKDIEPFFWRPQNGESLADVCVRLEKVLDTLHRECTDKRVILVCHGEVMWAFRVILERMTQQCFRELHLSKNPLDRLHNCQVLHYTRRDPKTGEAYPHANWMRAVRPTEDPVWTSGWQKISRTRHSNLDLLKIVEEYPAVIS